MAPAASFDLALRASAATSAGPIGGLAGYWGQYGSDSMKSYCDNNPEYITVSFVNSSPENEPSGWPGTNFAGHCPGNYFTYDTPTGPKQSNLWKNCYLIMEGIPYCQARGVKVLLSIGGMYSSSSNYAVTTEANGRSFADFLYNAFGPLQSSWTGPRPFDGLGYVNRIDGFDFDIEAPLDNAPYTAMINRFRQLDSSIVITGAPQCPLADPWAYMNGMIKNAKFDALFIQFYNNPDCDLIGSSSNPLSNSNYDAWESFIASTTYSKGAKLYVGLPADSSAAGSGYVDISAVKQLVLGLKGRASFGGISLWDLTRGASNIDSKTNLNYNQMVQNLLSYGDTTAPTTTTTVASTTTSSRSTTTTSSSTTTSPTSTTTTSSSSISSTTSSSSTTASTSTKPTSSSTSTSTTSSSTTKTTSSSSSSSSSTSTKPTSTSSSTTSSSSTSSKPTSTSTTSSKTTSTTTTKPTTTTTSTSTKSTSTSTKSTSTSTKSTSTSTKSTSTSTTSSKTTTTKSTSSTSTTKPAVTVAAASSKSTSTSKSSSSTKTTSTAKTTAKTTSKSTSSTKRTTSTTSKKTTSTSTRKTTSTSTKAKRSVGSARYLTADNSPAFTSSGASSSCSDSIAGQGPAPSATDNYGSPTKTPVAYPDAASLVLESGGPVPASFGAYAASQIASSLPCTKGSQTTSSTSSTRTAGYDPISNSRISSGPPSVADKFGSNTIDASSTCDIIGTTSTTSSNGYVLGSTGTTELTKTMYKTNTVRATHIHVVTKSPASTNGYATKVASSADYSAPAEYDSPDSRLVTTLYSTRVRTLTLCHASVTDCGIHSVTTEVSSWKAIVAPATQTAHIDVEDESPNSTVTVKATKKVYATVQVPVATAYASNTPDDSLYQGSLESTNIAQPSGEPDATVDQVRPDSDAYEISSEPTIAPNSVNNPDANSNQENASLNGYLANSGPTSTLVSLSRPYATGFQASPIPTNAQPLGVAAATGGCAGEGCFATPYTYTPPAATATSQPVIAGASSIRVGLVVVVAVGVLQLFV